MLTVIEGEGESKRRERPININGAGLVDISTLSTALLSDPHTFEMAINDLNDHMKKRLYKGLQKEIATCLKKSSTLLASRNELLQRGDDQAAASVYRQYKKICHREHSIWIQIKKLYAILAAS